MRKVKIAGFHDNLQVPGIGDLGKTVNLDDKNYKFRDVQLTWTGEGLEIFVKGRTVFVPTPNLKYMEFLPTATQASKPAA